MAVKYNVGYLMEWAEKQKEFDSIIMEAQTAILPDDIEGIGDTIREAKEQICICAIILKRCTYKFSEVAKEIDAELKQLEKQEQEEEYELKRLIDRTGYIL